MFWAFVLVSSIFYNLPLSKQCFFWSYGNAYYSKNCNSQRMWYIRSLFSEIREREGCLTANLPIDNRIVNILLEAVTRKAFFRRVSALARLCLAAIENFLVLEKCNKLWCHYSVFQKSLIFLVKNPKNLHVAWLFMYLLDRNGNCISGHYLLKLGDIYRANIPIFVRLV